MSDFEKFGKGHPYLPSGWGPQARADIPKNSPMLPDVNPAASLVARLTEKFGDDGSRNRSSANGSDGKDGLGSDGALGTAGGVGSHGVNGSVASQLASLTSLLASNGISYSAMSAGTSLSQRLDNASGSGECNEDGTITISLTI